MGSLIVKDKKIHPIRKAKTTRVCSMINDTYLPLVAIWNELTV